MNIEPETIVKWCAAGASFGALFAWLKPYGEALLKHYLERSSRQEQAEREHEARFLVAFEKTVAQTARFSDVLGAIEATQKVIDNRLDRIESHLGIQIPPEPRATLTGAYPAVAPPVPAQPLPPGSSSGPWRPPGG